MKSFEKILFTLFIVSIFTPFIFLNSEIILEGTKFEYVNSTPNFKLFFIPFGILAIYLICKIWEKDE